MPDKDVRFFNAKALIAAGKITTLEELYKQVPKKLIGQSLKVNPVRFSNVKSNSPGDFKFSEIVTISQLLETDIYKVVAIFLNSMV
jgi:hypothetical protein